MIRTILAVLSMTVAAWGQTALTAPQAGLIRDTAHSLRPVYGIAGNFLLGDPVATGVVSATYSGLYGLIKTDSTVAVIDRAGSIAASIAAPEGTALFAFARIGDSALAYLSASDKLLVWDGRAFETVPFSPTMLAGSAVVAIAAPDSEHAALIVQRDDGLWDVRMQLATGEVDAQTAIENVAAPVLMLATGELIYSDGNGLVIRRPDGSERHVDAQLPTSFEFQQMGQDWIQLRDLAGGRHFAIRITPNREQSYQLPEVDQ
jgi:hypothetical protein